MVISGDLFKNLFLSVIFFFLSLSFFLAVLGLHPCRLSLLVTSRSYSPLQCKGFSLRWLLLLQSPSSRCGDFSCVSWTLEHRLSNWGAQT